MWRALTLLALVAATPAAAQWPRPLFTQSGWRLERTTPFGHANDVTWNPADGLVWISRSAVGPVGIFRIEADGSVTQVLEVSQTWDLEAAPNGDMYFVDAASHSIWRNPRGTATAESWCIDFDDPYAINGLEISPPDHVAGIVPPGEGLVAARDGTGVSDTYTWRSDIIASPTLVRPRASPPGFLYDFSISRVDALAVELQGLQAAVLWRIGPGYAFTRVDAVPPVVNPRGVAGDGEGHAFVMDSDEDRLVAVDLATLASTTIASQLPFDGAGRLDLAPDGRRLAVTTDGAVHVLVRCELSDPVVDDCDSSGSDDACEIAWGLAEDCDGDVVPDACELAADPAADCDADGMLDSCEILAGAPDCNSNGRPDSCEAAGGDCDADGVPDDCRFRCAGVEIVFVFDSSGSMDNDAAEACDQTSAALAALRATGLATDAWFAMIATSTSSQFPCSQYGLTTHMGRVVPGSPPPPGDYARFGLGCGAGTSGQDWGRSSAIVAGLHPWLPNRQRIVVAVSDDAPFCGSPVTAEDTEVAGVVAPILASNRVRMVVLMPDDAPAAAEAAGRHFATTTGGLWRRLDDTFPEAFVAFVAEACAAVPNCDGDAQPDACEVAAGAEDGNADGVPDECQGCVGPPVTPGSVGASLRLRKQDADVVLYWSPARDAFDHEILRSPRPSDVPTMSEAIVGDATPEWLDRGFVDLPPLLAFYLVRGLGCQGTPGP